MIILNRCKGSSEIILCVLHKKSLAPILYAERTGAITKYYGTVLHSLQQHLDCVGLSGCHNERLLYF